MVIVVEVMPGADAVSFWLDDPDPLPDPPPEPEPELQPATTTAAAVSPARAATRALDDLFMRGLLPGFRRPAPGGARQGRGYAGATAPLARSEPTRTGGAGRPGFQRERPAL